MMSNPNGQLAARAAYIQRVLSATADTATVASDISDLIRDGAAKCGLSHDDVRATDLILLHRGDNPAHQSRAIRVPEGGRPFNSGRRVQGDSRRV
jgi:hypothetical protein